MGEIFKPGQKVYVLFWRRPEEKDFTRVQIYKTKKRRDDASIDLLTWGFRILTAEWTIPHPATYELKDLRFTPTCPKCGAELKLLYGGENDKEWVCPNACGSTLDQVMQNAESMARRLLGDES